MRLPVVGPRAIVLVPQTQPDVFDDENYSRWKYTAEGKLNLRLLSAIFVREMAMVVRR